MSPMILKISSCTLTMRISLSLRPQCTRAWYYHIPRHQRLLQRFLLSHLLPLQHRLPPRHLPTLQLLPHNRLPRHWWLPRQSRRRPQLRPRRRSLNRRMQCPQCLHLTQASTQTPKNLVQVAQVSAPLWPTRRKALLGIISSC